ncbi:MAG: hypothetical protein IPK15_00825 [Verrucomicrobia bacterium]|nr:hypothetical protein [Verrucomicrobiota bacterium]
MTRFLQPVGGVLATSKERPSWTPLLVAFAVALLAMATGGCAKRSMFAQALTPSYEPSNVFREDAALPEQIRRVALLPVTVASDDGDMAFGRGTLEPIVFAEIARVRRFEVVSVTSEELRLLTGRTAWTPEEKLPIEFFEKIRDKFGVDAVLFTQLTQYRPYEPLLIGWRMKLIDADEPHILWAVDEVFDARVPTVAAAASRHLEGNPDTGTSLSDSRSVLQSPRRFGRYTAHAVVQTMPGRAMATK